MTTSFYLIDPSFANNILISVPDLLASGEVNPHSIIAFFVARGLLSKLMFSCFAGWYLNHHPKNSRCIMHRCDTPDKLRDMISHGDICEQCEQYLKQNLPSQQQVSVLLNILESASNNTKRRSLFLSNHTPLPIVVKDYKLELYLDNCGILERIPLYPKERALYLTYLLFEEGLDRHSLAEHKELILKLYGRMVNIDDKSIIRDRIDALVDLEKNDFSISKSRINKAFSKLFNVNPILAKLYQIKGMNGEVRSIRLERKFVFSDEELPIENNFAKFQSNGIAFDMQNDHGAKIVDKENWSTSHYRNDCIPTFPPSAFDSFKPESSQELRFDWEGVEEIQFTPINEIENTNPDEADEWVT